MPDYNTSMSLGNSSMRQECNKGEAVDGVLHCTHYIHRLLEITVPHTMTRVGVLKSKDALDTHACT